MAVIRRQVAGRGRPVRTAFASLLLAGSCAAAPAPAPEHAAVIELTRIDQSRDPLRIDGRLDEPLWQRIEPITDFVVIEPDTLVPGPHDTLLRIAYDDRGLYVAADLKQPPETLIARLSGRDAFSTNRDSFNITIDSSGSGRYGYWFGVNLGDALMDGTVLPERNFSNDWDGPWRGRSRTTRDGWSAELFIPWSAVAMPAAADRRRMGVYASRKVAYLDQRWAFPALPQTRPKFMSALQPVELQDIAPRQQYNVYPFVAVTDDFVEEEIRTRIGADLFWRPSTNFQLLATLNPDFGAVEADEVVVNLSAVEVFFPDKRLFFQEGQEIFVASPRADTRGQGVGNRGAPYTMINTRRIGGQPREPDVDDDVDIPDRELIRPVDLFGAAKTTGQFGRLRYGVLAAFEDDAEFAVTRDGVSDRIVQPGNDYGVARVLYEDGVGGAYRGLGFLSTAVLNPDRDAIAHGVDAHYLSPRGVLKLDGQAMTSNIDGVGDGYGGFLDFEVTPRQGLSHRFGVEYFDDRFGVEYFDDRFDINDLGFLQRNDNFRIRSSLQLTRSRLSWARDNQFDVRGFVQRSTVERLFTGGGIFLSDRVVFDDLSRITARANFFPEAYDDLNSFGNGTFRIEQRPEANLRWDSNNTKALSFGVGAGFRTEDLGGTTLTAVGNLTWRPNDRFAVIANLAYQDRDGWLLHQQDDVMATFQADQWVPSLGVDYFFSARQQLRASLQWAVISAVEDRFYRVPATPGDLLPIDKPTGPGFRSDYSFSVSNYALQLRYRWEIAPLSDVFLVYTRQANLATALRDDGFGDIFRNAWNDPLADLLVLKVRYRLGS